MNRGEAQRHISDDRVYRFQDGGTYRVSQTLDEAVRALDEAASAAYVDMKRRELDEAMQNHHLRYGYDRPDLIASPNGDTP